MDALNDKIWGKDGKIIPIVRDKLIKLAHKIINVVETKVKVKHIYFTASLAGYNWTPTSDIDVHIIVDILENHTDKTLSDYFDLICKLFNSQHFIFIKGYKVEVNMKEKEGYVEGKAIYDLLNDKWFVKPTSNKRSLNDPDVMELTSKYQKRIDKIIDHRGSIEDAVDLKQEIKDLRATGLKHGGEYSIGNLVFKNLRNSEYIAKLFNYKNKLEDQALSLEKFRVSTSW